MLAPLTMKNKSVRFSSFNTLAYFSFLTILACLKAVANNFQQLT